MFEQKTIIFQCFVLFGADVSVSIQDTKLQLVFFFFSLYSITINWLAWISRYVIVALNVNMKWANDVTVNCYFFKLKYGMCLYCHRIFNFRMSWTLYDPVNWRNIELLDFEFEYVVWPYRHCTFFSVCIYSWKLMNVVW